MIWLLVGMAVALDLDGVHRAAAGAQAVVDVCRQSQGRCRDAPNREELAEAMAVLVAYERLVAARDDPSGVAAVHWLAPERALQLVGPDLGGTPPGWLVAPLSRSSPRLPSAPPTPQPRTSPPPEQAGGEASPERRAMSLGEWDELRSPTLRELARLARCADSIRLLEDLLGQPDMEPRAEMTLRLAELYREQARGQALEEVEAALTRCEADPTCFEPEPARRASLESTRQSLRLYGLLVAQYPDYERVDQALFGQAEAWQLLGKPDRALDSWRLLVAEHPDSDFAADAHLLIGEALFEGADYAEAAKAYELAAMPGHPRRPFALYKLSWCQYILGRAGDALGTLEDVLALSLSVGSGSDLRLLDEVLADLPRFADRAEEPQSVETALADRPELLLPALERLAAFQADRGRDEAATLTLRHLLSLAPESADAWRWQRELGHLSQGDARCSELQHLAEAYGPGSPWAGRQPAENARRAASGTEQALRSGAVLEHEACRQGASSACRRAEDLYRAHLALFDADDSAVDVHYALAELLYGRGAYEAAWPHYVAVVERDPEHPRARFCAAAAVHAAAALESAEPLQPGKGTGAAGQKLVASADQLVRLFPEDPLAAPAALRAAELLSRVGDVEGTVHRARAVIDLAPRSESAAAAARLALDALWSEGRLREVIELSDQLLRLPAVGDATLAGELRDINATATYRLIEQQLDRPGSRRAAADAYVAYRHRFPDSPAADLALNNAAVYYQQLGEGELARRVRRDLVESYRSSPYLPDHLAALGRAAEDVADFALAADWYEELANRYPDHRDAPDALYTAALFRWALGEVDSALARYQAFGLRYPHDPRATAIGIDLGRILQERGQHREAARQFQALLDTGRGTPGERAQLAWLAGEALEASGRPDQARHSWARSLPLLTAPEAAPWRARILLVDAGDALQRFDALGLGGGGGRSPEAFDAALQRQLAAKASALQDVEDACARVLEAGSAEQARAALLILAGSHGRMAAALRDSPVPPYLSAPQAAVYTQELNERARREDDRAVAVLDRAVELSFEFELYDQTHKQALARLDALRPDTWGALAEVLPHQGHMTGASSSPGFEPDP